MKVLTTPPYRFLASDIVDANDVARTLRYAVDAFADVSSMRMQETPLRLPFMAGEALTAGASLETRTARFRAPFDCTIERAILSANLVCSADVQVTIETAAGATPDGATVPWLSTGGALTAADTDLEDIAPERVSLVGGTTYLVKIVPTGTMTVDRFDLTLHLRFDRWQLTTSTTLVPPTVTIPRSGDARNATTVNASAIAIAIAALSLAANNGTLTPIVVSEANFVTPTNQVQQIPRGLNTRAQGRIVRIDLFAHWDAVSGDVVTGELLDQAAAVLETITVTNGATQQAASTLTCNRSLVSATANVTTTQAQDFSFRMRSNGATNVRKAYAVLWVAR
jgi:hypothetical protein